MKTESLQREIDSLPGRYIALLADLCTQWGVSKTQLLAHSPLAQLDLNAADTRVSLAELNWFVARAIKLTRQPAFGIYAASALKLATHGFFGFAILSSATLADAADMLEKYALLQSGPFFIERAQQADEQILRLGCHSKPPAELDATYAEAFLLTIAYVAKDLVADPIDNFSIRLKAPLPDYYASLADSLPCPLQYGQTENELHFPTALLDKPIKHANPASFQLAKTQCEQTLQELSAHGQIENRVRALICSDLSQPPDLPAVAKQCHLSTRSLKRKLAECGTGYTTLLEEIRTAAAIRYFTDQQLSVKEVALRLGFSSTTNFSRAFKKWTGKSPRHYLKVAEH